MGIDGAQPRIIGSLLSSTAILAAVTACGDFSDESVGIGQVTAPLTIEVGTRTLQLSRANVRTSSRPAEPPTLQLSSKDLTDWRPTRADFYELAEALRPITFKNGHEYTLATPDYAAARRVLELASGARATHASSYNGATLSEQGEQAPDVDKSYCCGTDTRLRYRSTTSLLSSSTLGMAWPHSGSSAGASTNSDWANRDGEWCTGVLIGESTALTAAHCMYNVGVGWYPAVLWGAGPDGGDSGGPIPSGFPQAIAEYSVTIPSAYASGTEAGSLKWDFAVIDFTGYDVPTPGADADYVGWGNFTDSEITNTTVRFRGVPSSSCKSNTDWPQIWGRSDWSGSHSVGSYWVEHTYDSCGGDGGRGFIQWLNSSYQVTATHSRSADTNSDGVEDTLYERRVDSTYAAAIEAWSTEF